METLLSVLGLIVSVIGLTIQRPRPPPQVK